jgi:hypothetical protein
MAAFYKSKRIRIYATSKQPPSGHAIPLALIFSFSFRFKGAGKEGRKKGGKGETWKMVDGTRDISLSSTSSTFQAPSLLLTYGGSALSEGDVDIQEGI